MKRIIIYGTVLVTALQLLTAADALTCATGIVCIHSNDGSEICAVHADGGINCPAGSEPAVEGTIVPICDAGNVACLQQNDNTGFCFPGFVCPAGSSQVGTVNLPTCSNNQQLCVYGSTYGCFDNTCPPGMIPWGTVDCTIPPRTCASGEKLCKYDNGAAFVCQSSGFDCWPGTQEWKPCSPSLDFSRNLIDLATGHWIYCFGGLTKLPRGDVSCRSPIFDRMDWPTNYNDSKLLAMYDCGGGDGTARWLLPLVNSLGFDGFRSDSYDVLGVLPQIWVNGFRQASPIIYGPFPEYCFVNGQLFLWSDPKCQQPVDTLGRRYNGNCFVNRWTMFKW